MRNRQVAKLKKSACGLLGGRTVTYILTCGHRVKKTNRRYSEYKRACSVKIIRCKECR